MNLVCIKLFINNEVIMRREIHKKNLSIYLIDVLVDLVMEYVYIEGIPVLVKEIDVRYGITICTNKDKIYIMHNIWIHSINVFDLELNKIDEIKLPDHIYTNKCVYIDDDHIYFCDRINSIYVLSRSVNEIIQIIDSELYSPRILGNYDNLFVGNNKKLMVMQKGVYVAEYFGNFNNFCIDDKYIYNIEDKMISTFDKESLNKILTIKFDENYSVLYKGVRNTKKYIFFKHLTKIIIVNKKENEIVYEIDLYPYFNEMRACIYDIQIINEKIYVLLNTNNGRYLCVIE